MDKRELSERDICSKFITPALLNAGWDLHHQVREEVSFTDGRIQVRGKLTSRGVRKRADYMLSLKANQPLALIEAKDNNHSLGSGMQQALEYAEILDIPFVYSSNGDAFLEHDRISTSGILEREIPLDKFPDPMTLWNRYKRAKGISLEQEQLLGQEYYSDGRGRAPRYYQRIAINRVVEQIIAGQNRCLLVMATGTGKTYTAFQIIWRLWKSRVKRRILFLADRNILIDQTMINDFKPFGSQMTKIQKRKVDKSYEVYLSLYQAITGPEEEQKIFKQFSPDFFDLIVIDECHRGSAREDSAWKEILDYFDAATHLGLTATPKETKYASNITYFGDPIYTYSLKQGIEDGFLAPYKVIRLSLDKDLGWEPEKGQTDKYGEALETRIYNQKDYDRTLVLEQRTALVARKITEWLQITSVYHKTIVFCEDIEHAERMRMAIANENADLVRENSRYVVKITGDDEIGKMELDHFIDPESRYPVVATTSRLMTTGVDAQTCQLIVLDRNIQSMTEFKQIIGRGTRINEDFGKNHFTIMDFRNVTRLFADPEFDGDPDVIIDLEPELPLKPPDTEVGPGDGEDADFSHFPRRKYYVNNVSVTVVAEQVQYYNADGTLTTESLKDFTRQSIRQAYSSLDAFLRKWKGAERKAMLLEEFQNQGLLLEELQAEVQKETGKDLDPFDLICHIVFDMPPLSRQERARQVKKRDYFSRYGELGQKVLAALLDKYAEEGLQELEDMQVLKLSPFTQYGSVLEIIRAFGGKEGYHQALRELESHLYDWG
ncbi:MAG: EcoAI/FtnUII family type I restriction enzme subunit R [Candidatus Sericytochromatia bacterium]